MKPVNRSSLSSVQSVEVRYESLCSAALTLLYPVDDIYLDELETLHGQLRTQALSVKDERGATPACEALRLLALLLAGIAVPLWNHNERCRLHGAALDAALAQPLPPTLTVVRLALYLYGETGNDDLLPLLRAWRSLHADGGQLRREEALLLDEYLLPVSLPTVGFSNNLSVNE